MDLDEDRDLVWIAKEGLKAPLPKPWKPCQTKEGDIYYFNFETGESTWDHPCDEHYKKLFEREKLKKVSKQPAKKVLKGMEKEKPGAGVFDGNIHFANIFNFLFRR